MSNLDVCEYAIRNAIGVFATLFAFLLIFAPFIIAFIIAIGLDVDIGISLVISSVAELTFLCCAISIMWYYEKFKKDDEHEMQQSQSCIILSTP